MLESRCRFSRAEAPAQALSECLHVLEVTGPAVHEALLPDIQTLLPGLVGCCAHVHSSVHSAAASCAEALASVKSDAILPLLLRYGTACIPVKMCLTEHS